MNKLFKNINENQFKLIGENNWDVKDFRTVQEIPEEKREVEIGNAILRYVNEISDRSDVEELKQKIAELAVELIELHK
jgi:hypothetical protein